MRDASRLRISSLFEGLADADLERCAALFEEVKLTSGSRVITQDGHSYNFFVVIDGEVEVRHDFEQLRRLGPGDFFGELGILGESRRTARVLTLTRCVLAKIMAWDLRTMLAEHPLLAARIEAAAAERRDPG